MEMSPLSPLTIRFAALTPALVYAFTPKFYEQERGDSSEAYCDPELYQGKLLSIGLCCQVAIIRVPYL
jgi:hypothetical protein